MEKDSIYHDLSLLLKSRQTRDSLVIFRGESERESLAGWMSESEETGKSIAQIDDLKKMIEMCNRCSDVEERKFGIGSGKNGVMIILNSPQLMNVVEKKFLKKESVDLLKKIVQAAGLAFGECYITNLVKCEIRDPLLKPSQIVRNCEAVIGKELELMKPRIVIVFGDILPLQKTMKESGDLLWFNMEHPITLIKNPDLKRSAWSTLKLVMEKLKEADIRQNSNE